MIQVLAIIFCLTVLPVLAYQILKDYERKKGKFPEK